MSDLENRRRSPRRRIESRMHPGWAVFLLAFFCGIMTSITMIYAVVRMDWGIVIYIGISTGLFFLGGKKAERLHD